MKIFTDLPKIDDTENQEEIRKTFSEDDELRGFPASNVDLGWLRKKAEGYWLRANLTSDEFKIELINELWSSVQRIRTIDIVKKQAAKKVWFEVSLVTKDDHDYYSYSFSVKLANKFMPRLVE